MTGAHLMVLIIGERRASAGCFSNVAASEFLQTPTEMATNTSESPRSLQNPVSGG
jgi:hypothetical protein